MMGHSATEADRLDKQHTCFRHVVDNRLLHPTLEPAIRAGKIRRILDIGTGTGIWCYDSAVEMQSMNSPGPISFVGADIAENAHWDLHRRYPASASSSEAYAEMHFQVADLNDDAAMDSLVEQYGQFDLINSRMMISAVKSGQWPAYINRIFKLLRPGGYVQLFEADMMNSHASRLHDQTVAEALVITHAVYNGQGLDPGTAIKLADWLFQAGFVRVRDTAHWCNPVVQRADGGLDVDEVLYGWHSTAYGVLKPLFLTLRGGEEYAGLLKTLPPQAFVSLNGVEPETLLANEAQYNDFMRRHEEVLARNPSYRTVFRSIIGQKPE